QVAEIAAAILEVGVEEEAVEVVAHVVMMLDVALGAFAPVELAEQIGELPAFLEKFVRADAVLPFVGAADYVDEIEYLTVLDDESPVHIGFGGAEAGVASDVADDPGIGDADGHRPELGVGAAVMETLPLMVDDCELAPLHIAPEHLVEQPHAFASLGPVVRMDRKRGRGSSPVAWAWRRCDGGGLEGSARC